MRRVTVLVVAMATLLLALVGPALSQQPYPPPPPDSGGGGGGLSSDATVQCTLMSEGRTVICEGEGFLADSTVNVEVRTVVAASAMRLPLATIGMTVAQDTPDVLVAAFTVTADDQGEFRAEYTLPCTFTDPSVFFRVSGQDSDGNATSFSDVLDVSDADACTSGEPPLGAPDSGGGALAFTGVNIFFLLVIALALIWAGTIMVRQRRNRQGPSAA